MDPQVETFVAAARDYVKRATAAELDGSDTSLAFVDHYIEKSGKVSDAVLELVARAIGVYFGEVVIGRLGGRWIKASDDPANWRIELGEASLHFSPVGMAAEALRQDEVPGYDASFQADPRFAEGLEEALSRTPPVDEKYYYSLTGRLETLEHAVQILVELDRQSKN